MFDDVGLPSFMVRFSRVTNKELFDGSDKPHPMFVVRGKVCEEVYISKYKNVIINGRAYSLPMQKPQVNITHEEAQAACRKKGEGWHLFTAMEHGFLANLSLSLGTLPHGNTNFGSYHADEREKGILAPGSSCFTLTASGPETWYHDHTRFGVDGLCGDIWERLAGLRLMNGILQTPRDNDAAADIDLSESSSEWRNVTMDGKTIRVIAGGGVRFTTDESDEDAGWDGRKWEDVEMDCGLPEVLRELGLFPGDPENWLYADTDGERLPLCGGLWSFAAGAGVFDVNLGSVRSSSGPITGFRSAYCKLGTDF